MINKDFFIHQCDVERSTRTKDSSGQEIETWTAVYSSLPCYIKLNSANESIIANKYADVATYRLYLETGYTINNNDRIISNGTFSVINVNNQINDHIEIDLIKV